MSAMAKRGRSNLKVFWPLEDPFPPPKESGGGRETVCPYGRIDGRPLLLHIWDGSKRPPDVDAVYVPDRHLWVAARIG